MKHFAAIFLVLAIGCSNSSREVCFAVVDGVPLTAQQVKDAVMIEAKILEMSGRPVKKADFISWANGKSLRMIGPMINARLLENAARSEGLVPDTNDCAQVLASYSRRSKVQASSFEDLAGNFGDLRDSALRQMEIAALLFAYDRVHLHQPLPDYVVRHYYAQVTNELKTAEKIDALARKNAEAAYARLEKGEDWRTVALSCSEDRLISTNNVRFAEFWTLTGSAAFGIEELAALLPMMKPGSYTRPLDTAQGMLIVRLIEKKNNLYRLARMMFRMARPVRVPRDREDALKILDERFHGSRQSNCLNRLQRAAKIEFPMGTNITYKIWN